MTDAKEAAERVVCERYIGAQFVIDARLVALAYLALDEERTELRTALQAAVTRMKLSGPSIEYEDTIQYCEKVLEDRT